MNVLLVFQDTALENSAYECISKIRCKYCKRTLELADQANSTDKHLNFSNNTRTCRGLVEQKEN